ncbi:hypothetical protein CP982_00475 [Streptomyces spectabilis]|uniref:Uncharacterized protein n=2 Tax=Streptomyces spectabilis TaxID=68270 RepID=A0A5P2WYZ9_STRST|nr:hypothetical protein CP982_00475 [Streptomyces spectabilis]
MRGTSLETERIMSRTLVTSLAMSAAALGTVTTLAIGAAGPAAALSKTEPWQLSTAFSTAVGAAHVRLGQPTGTRPVFGPTAGAERQRSVAGLPIGNAVLAITNLALPERVPDEFKDLLPPEVTDFYNGLSEEEKTIIKEIAAKHDTFQTEDQALDYLKAQSEKLYNKAVELRNLLKSKLDALTPAAKAFVDSVVEELKHLGSGTNGTVSPTELQVKATVIVVKYKSLPEGAKESLKTNFPKMASILQSETAQQLAGAFRPVLEFVDSVLEWGTMNG